MKKVYTFAFIFSLISCISPKEAYKNGECSKTYKSQFSEITTANYQKDFGDKNIDATELRYQCVHSTFYIKKVMFDTFGKWDAAFFPDDYHHPVLMWKNVDLFSNGKKYTVFANGKEEWQHIYTSVMVLDENDKDVLAQKDSATQKVENYYGNLIEKNKHDERKFYDIYWSMVRAHE